MPLKIAAKVDKVDQQYFKSTIEPLLSQTDVEFIGEIGEHQKVNFSATPLRCCFPLHGENHLAW